MPPGKGERRNGRAAKTDWPTERPEQEPTWAGSNWEPTRPRQREREHARLQGTWGRTQVPNGSKLSDRGWREET